MDGISIFYLSDVFYDTGCFLGKKGDTQKDRQTNSNFINIDDKKVWFGSV